MFYSSTMAIALVDTAPSLQRTRRKLTVTTIGNLLHYLGLGAVCVLSWVGAALPLVWLTISCTAIVFGVVLSDISKLQSEAEHKD
ncbi:MAG TPA: hypothetical protein VFM18_05315 [Methanosarcina sp.]|nr:hypothetical protein [Methanosarcina sp.]